MTVGLVDQVLLRWECAVGARHFQEQRAAEFRAAYHLRHGTIGENAVVVWAP